MNDKKTLKILAAGDFHGQSTLTKRLAEQAEQENVDLVVLCGDLLESHTETQDIIKPFLDKGKKVLFVPGNHDGFALGDFLADFYGIKNLHNSFEAVRSVGFFGCGGANVGLEALPEEDIFTTLKKGFYYVKGLDKKIMVTHVHPAGTKMEKLSKFVPPSTGVLKAVQELKPDILLCSHIHEAEGIEEYLGKTKVINVGRKGKVFEIPLN